MHNLYALGSRGYKFLRNILFALVIKHTQIGLAYKLRLVLVQVRAVRGLADNILGKCAKDFLGLFVPQNIFSVVIFYGQGNRQVVNNRLQEVARVDNSLFLRFLLRNILRHRQHHKGLALFVKNRGFN